MGTLPLLEAFALVDLPPAPAAVERAAGLAGPDAVVLEVRALTGGTHARTYLIRTANPGQEFILREFPPGDDAPGNESRVLSALGGLGGLAPRLLASGAGDAPGTGAWTLISRLPGTADLTPDRPAAWAGQWPRARGGGPGSRACRPPPISLPIAQPRGPGSSARHWRGFTRHPGSA